jgi:3-oxoacyl-[acyl-carrier-protein] synthase II
MNAERRAVVTGLGQYSSLGTSVHEFWAALIASRSGLRELRLPDRVGGGLGAPMGDADASPKARQELALRSAILEALADADLLSSGAAGDVPVVVGTNFGDTCSVPDHEDFLHSARTVLTELGLCGEIWGVSVACASGAAVLGLASDLVRYEGARRVLVCAYDVITPYNYRGLAGLRAISPDTVRPFDRRRSGTLLGEGAAALVVEEAAQARADGATSYGEILGYGLSNDAHHFTAPEPSGVGMRAAMGQALRESRLGAGDIGHLNAHGTGTPHNDVIETRSVRAVFGEAAQGIPITSIKAALGHTMGAAGALELMATLLSVQRGIVPPTLNHQVRDPDCDLDYVIDQPRRVEMRAAMSNSYGLWGCNSSVIVGRGEAA